MEFQTRQATAEDREPLFALYDKVLRKHIADIWGWNDEWQRKDFNDHFHAEEIGVLTELGRVIGYMQVEDRDEALWLRMIAILPEYQGKGIGGCVLRQLIQKANCQAKDVALVVFKINTDARRFYERFGFKVEGETVTHFSMRRNRSELPNKALHATSEPAQGADSSAHEG